jgi:hypothetical protein
MVGTSETLLWHDFACESPEAALHPIADNGPADLLRDSETHAHRRVGVLPLADEQNEAGSGRAFTGISGDEVGAPGNRD